MVVWGQDGIDNVGVPANSGLSPGYNERSGFHPGEFLPHLGLMAISADEEHNLPGAQNDIFSNDDITW